jgi:PAS domain S-box-containing protein
MSGIRIAYPASLETENDFVALAESLKAEPLRYSGSPWLALGLGRCAIDTLVVLDHDASDALPELPLLASRGYSNVLAVSRKVAPELAAHAATGSISYASYGNAPAALASSVVSAFGVAVRAIHCECERRELASARSKVEASIEASPIGIIISEGPRLKVTVANRSAATICGTTVERLRAIDEDNHANLEWRILRADGTPYAPEELPLYRALARGETINDESQTIVRADGSERHLVSSAAPLKGIGGEINGAIVLFTDVSDIVLTRRELARSQARYKELFEAESDAIFLIENEEGRLLEANEAAAELYGYSREELLSGMRNVDLSAEVDETRHVTQSTPVVKDNVVRIALRWHKKRDGTAFPVEITGRFFELEGRPVHIAAIRDIGARLEADERLAAAVEEKASLLKELRHRTKNTLALISSLVELEMGGSGPDERLERMRDRIASFATLYGLLQDSSGFDRVSLDAYCARVTDLIRDSYALPERGIALDYRGGEAQATLKDAEAFGLILSEVVTNAAKHAFPGDATGAVSVRLDGDASEIRLSVEDNGVGIDAAPASGTGRAIADMLARQLGGSLETVSRPDFDGTRVILRMPTR